MSECKFNSESDCETNGHSLVKVVSFDNGRSTWGMMVCQKCGAEYEWQFDYAESCCIGETKPY